MSASFNPEMLVLARESRALSQIELARLSGVPQGAISKYENNVLEVTNERVNCLADALNYPPRFFYRDNRVYAYGSSCYFHRKQSSLSARKLREIEALMNVRRLELAPLLRDLQIETDVGFDQLDVEEYESPSKIANIVRRNWRLPTGPIRNLIGTIEAAGGIVVKKSFGTRKLDAISQWIPGHPPFFFVNSDVSGERLRFTLAHEIGHIVMHAFPTGYEEQEANEFAAELLMPEREIRSDLHNLRAARLVNLKAYWKTSMAALIVRARDLEEISDRQSRRLFMQLNKMRYRLEEPNPLPQEKAQLVSDVVEFHRNAHGYSVAELSYVTTLNMDEFASIYIDEPEEDDQPGLRLVK